jgi:hypothetical protein
MGQLLVMMIVPPIVGVVTYIVFRFIWDRDENGASETVRRHDPSAATHGGAVHSINSGHEPLYSITSSAIASMDA